MRPQGAGRQGRRLRLNLCVSREWRRILRDLDRQFSAEHYHTGHIFGLGQGATAAVFLSPHRVGRFQLRFSRQPDQDFYRTPDSAGDADCLRVGGTPALAFDIRCLAGARLDHALAAAQLLPLSPVQHQLARHSLSLSGSVAGSYRVFLLNGFLSLITLYVMAPFMHQRLKAYQHDNSWFGRTRASFMPASASSIWSICSCWAPSWPMCS